MKYQELSELTDGTYVVLDVNESEMLLAIPLLPDFGYWVATKPVTVSALVGQPHALIGIWTAEDGTVHIDHTIWVERLGAAAILGKQCYQTAIWDCANGNEIYL